MGARETDDRLQKLFDDGKNVYSISKLNTIENCEYEAYLTYILGDRGINGVYGVMGGRIHDVLEAIINFEATDKDLIPAMEEELAELEMLDIDFPKDFKGGTSIRDNWIADISHFCKNFVRPRGKFTTEELVLYQFGENRFLQGYIDLIKHFNKKTIGIYDWKTSTNFSKEDLIHHGRQLIAYSVAKEAEGYTVKEIGWIMLKYVEVTFWGRAKANSREKTLLSKVLNRSKVLKELKPYIESDLIELRYEEVDIEIMLLNAVKNNTFKGLPKEIKSKYKIKPYLRKYDLTDELRQEAINYINAMADLYESKTTNEQDWKPIEINKKNSFYCNALCNHRKSCPYIKQYNDLQMLIHQNDEDLF